MRVIDPYGLCVTSRETAALAVASFFVTHLVAFTRSKDRAAFGAEIARRTHQMKAHGRGARVREGKYSNYFEVGFNLCEFYVDFGQYDPQSERVQMHTRIVTSPTYAKMMGETLASSVENFERQYGVIRANADELDAMEMVRESLKRTETKS